MVEDELVYLRKHIREYLKRAPVLKNPVQKSTTKQFHAIFTDFPQIYYSLKKGFVLSETSSVIEQD